jgi:hypothetical protein
VIIRRTGSTLYLITQPAHAALSARIMRQWGDVHFPETPRKASILHAIEQHDCGWAAFDEELALDASTGQLLDFTEVPDAVKHESSFRGIPALAADPYAAALAAQHRLHVYRRNAGDFGWKGFFAEMTAIRDSYLRTAGSATFDELLGDYRFVRAGDLASLAFCNEWTNTQDDGSGYSMKFDGRELTITPDPLNARTIDIDIDARVMENRRFNSAAEAREALASAPVVTLKGIVRGTLY